MRIKEITTTQNFGYLWLKYVTGFDLNVHCAKCLIGKYSKRISPELMANGKLTDIELDEYPYRYIYLCGVTSPYVWADNLHLALEPFQGGVVDFNFNGTQVIIEDAKVVPIKAQSVYKHPKGHIKAYNTCRNWRFAYQQTMKDNL